MARRQALHTPEEWHQIGRDALLDLVKERLVIPWPEAEARISWRAWKEFEPVQPVQLGGARRSLVDDGLICEESTRHDPAVTTVRVPFPPDRKREISRLRGRVRKSYRKYLAFAADGTLCGKHAERVVLASARAAASDAGLWVPPQSVGEIDVVRGVSLSRGPLDVLAHILEVPEPRSEVALVVEVKNIHSWVYPSTSELWELLIKAAELAETIPVMPVLACPRTSYQAGNMAMDIGFLNCYYGGQLFNPSIDEAEFSAIVDEFGLVIERFEGAHPAIVQFLTKTLRRSPPLSPPRDEDIQWYKRQAQRFQTVAPLILQHEALASGGLTNRRAVLDSFRATVKKKVSWPLVAGW